MKAMLSEAALELFKRSSVRSRGGHSVPITTEPCMGAWTEVASSLSQGSPVRQALPSPAHRQGKRGLGHCGAEKDGPSRVDLLFLCVFLIIPASP